VTPRGEIALGLLGFFLPLLDHQSASSSQIPHPLASASGTRRTAIVTAGSMCAMSAHNSASHIFNVVRAGEAPALMYEGSCSRRLSCADRIGPVPRSHSATRPRAMYAEQLDPGPGCGPGPRRPSPML